MKKKTKSWGNFFSILLRGTKELPHLKGCRPCWQKGLQILTYLNVKEKDTAHPFNPNLG